MSTSYKKGVIGKTLFTAEDFQGVKKIMDVDAGSYEFSPYAQNDVNAQLVCVNSKGIIVETASTHYELGFAASHPLGSFGFDCSEGGAVYLVSAQPFSAKFYLQ